MIAFVGARADSAVAPFAAVPGQRAGDLLVLATWERIATPSGWAAPSGSSPNNLFLKFATASDSAGWNLPGVSCAVGVAYRGTAPSLVQGWPNYQWEGQTSPLNDRNAFDSQSSGHEPLADPGDRYVRIWLFRMAGATAGALTVAPSETQRLRTVVGTTIVDVNDMATAPTETFTPNQNASVDPAVSPSPLIMFYRAVLPPALVREVMVV